MYTRNGAWFKLEKEDPTHSLNEPVLEEPTPPPQLVPSLENPQTSPPFRSRHTIDRSAYTAPSLWTLNVGFSFAPPRSDSDSTCTDHTSVIAKCEKSRSCHYATVDCYLRITVDVGFLPVAGIVTFPG